MPLPGVPRPIHNYNFGAVVCSVGGVVLSNYGSDGGIAMELPSAIAESEQSADGVVTYTNTSDERVKVTITLMETSQAIPALQAVLLPQLLALFAGAPVPPIILGVFDPATGDSMLGGAAILLQEPSISKSKGASTREYVFEVPYGRHRILQGPLNVLAPLG